MTTTSSIASAAPPLLASNSFARFAGNQLGGSSGPTPLFEALLQLPIFTEPFDDGLRGSPADDQPLNNDVEDHEQDSSSGEYPVVLTSQPLEVFKPKLTIVDEPAAEVLTASAAKTESIEMRNQVRSGNEDIEPSWLERRASKKVPLEPIKPPVEEHDDVGRPISTTADEVQSVQSRIEQAEHPVVIQAAPSTDKADTTDTEYDYRTEDHQQVGPLDVVQPVNNHLTESAGAGKLTAVAREYRSTSADSDSKADRGRRSQRLSEIRESRSEMRHEVLREREASPGNRDERTSGDRPDSLVGQINASQTSDESAMSLSPPSLLTNPEGVSQNGAPAPTGVDTSSASTAAANGALLHSLAMTTVNPGSLSHNATLDATNGVSAGGIASGNGTPSSESVNGRTPSSEGSRGTLTAHQETRLLQRVIRGFEQLGTNPGQLRLRLHPPQLGSLQLRLHLDADSLSARLEVESTAARDALIENLPQLRQRLAEQGIQIERFEVQLQSKDEFRQSNNNPFDQQSPRNGNSGSDRQHTWGNWRSTIDSRNDIAKADIVTPPTHRTWTSSRIGLDLRF